jgi:hypothetical protein
LEKLKKSALLKKIRRGVGKIERHNVVTDKGLNEQAGRVTGTSMTLRAVCSVRAAGNRVPCE